MDALTFFFLKLKHQLNIDPVCIEYIAGGIAHRQYRSAKADSLLPVSYTLLDVYKRQIHIIALGRQHNNRRIGKLPHLT